MRKITDAFKVPREMLAYIVNTTAPHGALSRQSPMDYFYWRSA